MRTVAVTVVIPAYNEAARLPPYLAAIKAEFTRSGATHEVIVVDDGSTDRTAAVVAEAADLWPQLRLIRHPANRGKGAAVRTGVLDAAGRTILVADADGATPIGEADKLHRGLDAGADVAVGSRLRPGARVEPGENWRRRLGRRGFAAVVRAFFHLPIRDTQCGFKLFRRHVAVHLFQQTREPGYLFEVEVLVTAAAAGYRIAEVPIRWRSVAGSKVSFARDGSRMVLGLVKYWLDRSRTRVMRLPREVASSDSCPR